MMRTGSVFVLLIFSLSSWSQNNDEAEIQKLAQTLIEKINKKDPDSARVWKTGGQATFIFSQTSFTNWAAGGDNSIAGNSLANMFANYNKKKASWDNILELGYGLVSLGDEGLRKSDDKIDIASKYGRVAYKKWNYSSLINFKSQFANGYEYPNDSVIVSKFLAPAYILLAVGLDYKPDDKMTVFISPFTGKTTIVNDQALADSGAFGMEPALMDTLGNRLKAGTNIRYEFGGYLKFFYKNEILKDIDFQTKLEFFFL